MISSYWVLNVDLILKKFTEVDRNFNLLNSESWTWEKHLNVKFSKGHLTATKPKIIHFKLHKHVCYFYSSAFL